MKYLLKVALFAIVFNIALTPICAPIATYFGYATIICFCLYPVVWFILNRRIKTSIILLAVIILLAGLTSLDFFEFSQLQSKAVPVLSFLFFYWSLSLTPNSSKSENLSFRDVSIASYMLAIIFILFSFADFDFTYTPYGKYGLIIFTMGLGNPNGTAIYVLFVSMILLINFVRTQNIYLKFALLLPIGMLAYILYLLSSRMALLCFIVAAFCVVFYRTLKAKKIFRYLILLAPALMILLQFFLNDVIGQIEILGKRIDTGRYEMYVALIRDIIASPVRYIMGNMCKYNFHNFHNGLLTVFASIGVMGTALIFRFWNIKLRLIEQKINNNKYHLIGYFFVLILLFDAVSESMTINGAIPYSIFVFIMVKIAQGDIDVSEANRLNKSDLKSKRYIKEMLDNSIRFIKKRKLFFKE